MIMNQKRPTSARLLAGAVALGGTVFAVFLAGWSFEVGFPRGLLVYLVFSPGWFAYFALIVAAAGKRLPGDPFTTWIPCILVNAVWFVLMAVDRNVVSLVGIYTLIAIGGGTTGLVVELAQRYADSIPSDPC